MSLLNDFFENVIIPFVEFMASPFIFLAELLKGGESREKKEEKQNESN